MGKMGQFPHFGPQSAKKGARNHLFNKPFGPGRKMRAEMRFWAQKCDFGGQNAILGPKRPKMRFGLQNHFLGYMSCPGSKGLLNKGFRGSFFALLEPKCKSELNFAFLGNKVQKGGDFALLEPAVLK